MLWIWWLRGTLTNMTDQLSVPALERPTTGRTDEIRIPDWEGSGLLPWRWRWSITRANQISYLTRNWARYNLQILSAGKHTRAPALDFTRSRATARMRVNQLGLSPSLQTGDFTNFIVRRTDTPRSIRSICVQFYPSCNVSIYLNSEKPFFDFGIFTVRLTQIVCSLLITGRPSL
jgi:hypothetical protein